MLALENPKPEAIAFQKLMIETNNILNQQARLKHDYFSKRVGILLEDDVADALCYCSKGTPFEGTIIKVSGQKFPDIIANKLYGVEVKSTKGIIGHLPVVAYWKQLEYKILREYI